MYDRGVLMKVLRGSWKPWEGLQTQNEGLKQISEMAMFNLSSTEAWVGISPADSGKKGMPWKSIEVSEYVVFWELQLVGVFVEWLQRRLVG